MTRLVFVVCIVLLLASVGWLLLLGDDSAELVSAPADANTATLATGGAQQSAAASSAPSATEASPERQSATEAPVPEQSAIPADAKWIDVLVVDKLTLQPIAGADAVWSDETTWAHSRKLSAAEREQAARDMERMARQWGWRGRSDREGTLRVHLGKQMTAVFVRHAGSYGYAHFRADQEPPKNGYRVLLELDCAVHVHVVDAVGKPAEGVGLSLEGDDSRKQPMYSSGELRTDHEGNAAFLHAQQRRTVQWGPKQGQLVVQWRLFVCIPGLEIPPVLIDVVQIPSEPIEVRLPPTGRLRAKAIFEGAPVPGLESIAFHAGLKADENASALAVSAFIDADGWARFHHVPLGKQLFVMLQQASGQTEREVPGPTLQGQEVEVTFDLAESHLVLTGRLLDGNGAAIANEQVIAGFDATVSSGGAEVQTDAAGRFVLSLAYRQADSQQGAKLKRLVFEWHQEGGAAQSVEVPPRDLVRGRNELGDLRFGLGDLVVSGRFEFDTPGTARTWFHVTRPQEGRRPTAPERWHYEDGLQVDVRDDGSFEVRGKLTPGRQRIEVQGDHHLPVEPVEFAIGARDLVIPVQRGLRLSATCLLPDGVPQRLVQLRLQPIGSGLVPKPATERDWLSWRGDPLQAQEAGRTEAVASYEWSAVPAGTYTLRVETPGLAEPYAVVPDLVVPPPAGGDPRLENIDLRPTMTTLRLRVRAAKTSRGQEGFAFLLPQADEGDWHGFPIAVGEMVLPVPRRPVDVLVAADGSRPATLRGAVEVAEVTLEAWPTAQVTFQGLEALPAGAILRVGTRGPNTGKRDARRYRARGSSGPLESLLAVPTQYGAVKDGVVTLMVGDGATTLMTLLMLEAGGDLRFLTQGMPNQLVAGAPITVQLSADEIRAAVAELQQQAARDSK